MQDLPEKSLLLDAIGAFLDRDVRPKTSDPAIAFRLRIAAHLLGVVAREIAKEDEHDLRQLETLRVLLGAKGQEAPPLTRQERVRAILVLERDLVKHIRSAPLDDRAMLDLARGIRAILIDKLAVAQPKFDTRTDIE
jgi:uncharacterized protein DUF6285